jgi:hypothetical protein
VIILVLDVVSVSALNPSLPISNVYRYGPHPSRNSETNNPPNRKIPVRSSFDGGQQGSTNTRLGMSAPTIFISEMEALSSPFLVAGVALVLGVAAQLFINQMLQGEQGLGAFLKDGSGYNKSGFRNLNGDNTKNEDPLPWLKLPKLDFVEVAGQEDENRYIQELERLRYEMNQKLEEGSVEEATAVREQLEAAMKEAGIEFKSDN